MVCGLSGPRSRPLWEAIILVLSSILRGPRGDGTMDEMRRDAMRCSAVRFDAMWCDGAGGGEGGRKERRSGMQYENENPPSESGGKTKKFVFCAA